MEFFKTGGRTIMVKQQLKIFMVVLLMVALSFSGANLQALAAVTSQSGQGTVTAIGTDETNPLVPETRIQIGDQTTTYDALVQAVGEENIDASGGFINGIKNMSSSDPFYWFVFVNGIGILDAANQYKIFPNDKVSFNYLDWHNAAHVSLKVVGPNDQAISTQDFINIVGSPTALQLLQVTLGTDKIGLKDTQYGPMITSINGTEAQGNSYWSFLVNDQYENVGADGYQLKPNDQVTFKYVTYTPTSGSSDTSGNTNSGTDSNTNTTAAPTPEIIPAATLQKSMDTTSHFILNNALDEWSAVALNKAGKTVPTSYLENVVQDIVNKKGKFHFITDPERYILGIQAAGGDPTNISGYNLIQSIYNGDVTSQGINGVIYALIALDSGDFNIPTDAKWTKDKLVSELLKNQTPDGRWSLSAAGDLSDADITSMALTALAPYKGQTAVENSINSAINYLSKTYQGSAVNSQTTAQIIIALSALGKYDTSAQLFEKNGSSIMSYLMSFQNSDGGFALNSGEASDLMATQQGLLAIDAYQLKGPLYYWTDPQQTPVPPIETSIKQGKTLPNTATNSANLVLAGLLLIIAGTALVYYNRKRKA
jgi:LPXTG-motif cell wall-anchored protein